MNGPVHDARDIDVSTLPSVMPLSPFSKGFVPTTSVSHVPLITGVQGPDMSEWVSMFT